MDDDTLLVLAGRIMAEQVFENEKIVDENAPVTLTRERLRMYLAGAYSMGMKHGGMHALVLRIFGDASAHDETSEARVESSKLH